MNGAMAADCRTQPVPMSNPEVKMRGKQVPPPAPFRRVTTGSRWAVATQAAGAKLLAVRVGIDTGGTFTDLVSLDDEGNFRRLKVPSTPGDPARARIEGLTRTLAGGGAGRLEAVAHGTTVATNAMLEQRFQSLALVTTRGFRHVLEIARQSVPSGYGNSYFWVKPDRIVPLERVREGTERLHRAGPGS